MKRTELINIAEYAADDYSYEFSGENPASLENMDTESKLMFATAFFKKIAECIKEDRDD